MIIHEHYSRTVPVPYNSKHGETDVVIPHWLLGIELEIENFNPEATQSFGGFTFTKDGSLRETEDGIGIEAVSKPVQAKHLEKLLRAFFHKFDITESNYTERCSTHVHVNVDVLTYEQLSAICLIYQTVESLLFEFIGEERDKNIFCVPWNQCSLGYNIVSKIEQVQNGGDSPFRRWQKYSALNLIPVSTQGTIEFRHLGGTCSVERIMSWVNLILCIVRYSIEHPLAEVKDHILQMNTISNYHVWLENIFGSYTKLLCVSGYETLLSRGVVDSKLMVAEEIKTPKSPGLATTATAMPVFRPVTTMRTT